VVAKSAGASEEVVAKLAQEATAAKEVRQTPGGRLDSSRARVERAEKKSAAARDVLEATREKLLAAEARLAELENEERVARDELANVEAEFARGLPLEAPQAPSLLDGVRVLLERLEGQAWRTDAGVRASPPEPVLDAMRALHAAMDAAAPSPQPGLDRALDEESGEGSGDEAPARGSDLPGSRKGRGRSEPPAARTGSASRTPPPGRDRLGRGAPSRAAARNDERRATPVH